jgi:hypothetical protein
VVLDIEGNQRAVIDAKDRVVMRYDYDLLGSRIHQASMEAGERWMLLSLPIAICLIRMRSSGKSRQRCH